MIVPVYADVTNNYLMVNEDASLSVPITYLDYDFDPLTVAVSSTNENVSASLNASGYFVDLAPDANFNGSTTITVSVDDGEASVSTAFDVTVVAVNDAPSMVSISDVSALEETSTTVGLNATDIDLSLIHISEPTRPY